MMATRLLLSLVVGSDMGIIPCGPAKSQRDRATSGQKCLSQMPFASVPSGKYR